MPNDRSVEDGRPLPAPPWTQLPRARRRATSRPPLDRDRVVAAALEIIDAEGVDALSIRRLAAALGTSPMAVYWHVQDKAALLDLVGEAVLDTIDVPAIDGDWQEQLRTVHRAMLDTVLRHPNAAELLIGRARYGRAGIALFERLLTILLGVGLDPKAAFDAYQSLYLFLLGYIATISRTPAFVAAQRDGIAYLRSLDAALLPAIGAVAPVIGERVPRDQFEVGLDVVIAGIAARLVE